MIADLKTDPKGVFIELEGHTEKVGSKEYNEVLGAERPEDDASGRMWKVTDPMSGRSCGCN